MAVRAGLLANQGGVMVQAARETFYTRNAR